MSRPELFCHTDKFEDLKRLAANAPKISLDDPRVELSQYTGSVGHTQYHNNLYTRFDAVRRGDLDRAIDEQRGYDVSEFCRAEPIECEGIFTALQGIDLYHELFKGYTTALREEFMGAAPEGSSDLLNQATGHPLGLKAIAMAVWDELNPRLEAAALKISASQNIPQEDVWC